jgi:plastocyanin domain-containing protein
MYRIRRRTPAPKPIARTNGPLHVRVRGGYHPNTLCASAGRPIQISFLREESAACSERVVFPEFGKNVMLPTGRWVLVELPPVPPGRYQFTCAMNMLTGTLVVRSASGGGR